MIMRIYYRDDYTRRSFQGRLAPTEVHASESFISHAAHGSPIPVNTVAYQITVIFRGMVYSLPVACPNPVLCSVKCCVMKCRLG